MDFRQLIRRRFGLLLVAALVSTARAGDFPLPAGWKGRAHGFVLLNYSARPDFAASPGGGGLGGHGFLLGDQRMQLKLEARSASGTAGLLAKPELFFDAVDEKFDVNLREGYLDFAHGSWDVRLGRQIVTWGVGDLVFINDVFPKDYAAFFSGRPLEYLKQGVDAVGVNFQSESFSAEWIVIPSGLFTSDRLPPRARFFQFDPLPGLPRQSDEPAATFDHTEMALRIYRNVAETEVAVYAYLGFWRSFSLRPDNPAAPARAIESFPKVAVFGASARRSGLGGVWGAEIGYYDSRDDRTGTNPAIENSQLRFILTYQRQLAEDFTGSIEYYGEQMQHYAAHRRSVPPGFPTRAELRDLVGVRLTKLLRYQTLRLSLFSFFSPRERDFFMNPEISYNFSDRLWAAVGGNIFGGPAASFFGQFGRNDNAYLSVRHSH